MERLDPHTEAANLNEPRVKQENDPASKRARIAAKARINPKEKFNNLMHLVTRELIEERLNKIPGKSATGVDRMTKEQAKAGFSWIVPPLVRDIHSGQYKAPPVRRVYIPKASGGERPLGVPGIIDRSIQAAVASVLNEIYEQDFLPCSFGFRPKLSCHHALATLNQAVDKCKLQFALEVDIRDFFGSINHEWMMKFLGHRISDPRMLKIIEGWLKAGVFEDKKVIEMEKGTPQGGSISPLLANIYLHYVLDLWFEKAVKPKLRGQARLVRYADDFVLLFANPKDRKNVESLLKVRLGQFGLTVSDEKTHNTDLGYRENRGQDRRHVTFLGFTIFRKKMRNRNGVLTVFQTDGSRFRRAKAALKVKMKKIMHRKIEDQVRLLNLSLVGHFNYYGMAGNGKTLTDFRLYTMRLWRKSLSRRSQKGKVSWQQLNEMIAKHRLVLPRTRIPYGALQSYVRL